MDYVNGGGKFFVLIVMEILEKLLWVWMREQKMARECANPRRGNVEVASNSDRHNN
jgi:hypothetical protein